MPHNESKADRPVEPEPESTKPSLMSRIKANAAVVGKHLLPAAAFGTTMFLVAKTNTMDKELGKLAEEVANLTSAATAQS